MVNIIQCSKEDFIADVAKGETELYLFGAGMRCKSVLDNYHLADKVVAIIDNYSARTSYIYTQKTIPIIRLSDLKQGLDIKNKNNIKIFITPRYQIYDIIEQLDEDARLNGVSVYIGALMDDFYVKIPFEFTDGPQKIPKKLHYCWFGGTEIPDHLQKFINGWHRLCPDYEIFRWDESNYDVKKNEYMMEAYDQKKWGFVPDFARMDIIYHEGGIYLDTDVELLKRPDALLNDDFFCGFNDNNLLNFGLGFGAVKHNKLLRNMIEQYHYLHFVNKDGSLNLKACSVYHVPPIVEWGFTLENKYQKVNGCVLYPSEVFAPAGGSGLARNYTGNTISCHHSEFSWGSKENKIGFNRTKKYLPERLGMRANCF